MRKLTVVLALMLGLGMLASAQDLSRAEAFGGYQYGSIDAFGIKRANLNGWNGQFTRVFHRNFGVTGDVSGLYGTPDVGGFPAKMRYYTYMGGLTLRHATSKGTPFVHALFGAMHASIDDGALSATSFAWALGGGLDFNVSKNLAVRAAQIDYLGTKFNYAPGSDAQNNMRLSVGVVYKF